MASSSAKALPGAGQGFPRQRLVKFNGLLIGQGTAGRPLRSAEKQGLSKAVFPYYPKERRSRVPCGLTAFAVFAP